MLLPSPEGPAPHNSPFPGLKEQNTNRGDSRSSDCVPLPGRRQEKFRESKELNQEEARKHQESKQEEQQLWKSVLVPSASQTHHHLSFMLLAEERWKQLCIKESLLTYQTAYLETFNPLLCPRKRVPCNSVIRFAIKWKLLGVFLKSTDVRTMERCNYKRVTQIWYIFLFLALTLAEEITKNQTYAE